MHEAKPMNPIKVKAYGLFSITKKQYTILQTVVFGILAVAFLLTFFYDLGPLVSDRAWIYVGIVAFLEVIEAVLMFKKFKEKERGT